MPKSKFVMINNYLIDVSIKEDHTFECDVTDYPTESGQSFSDNIRPKPIQITMEGVVSNSPLGEIIQERKAQAATVAAAVAAVNPIGTASIAANSEPNVSAVAAYELLRRVWDQREPVTIRTSLGTFERMAPVSLTIPRDKDTGDALHFTATFQQIQVVTNARVRIKTAIRAGKKKDKGPLAAVDKTAALRIWAQGRVPGKLPIVAFKVIYYAPKNVRTVAPFEPGGIHIAPVDRYFHKDGVQLTPAEVDAYRKDTSRDHVRLQQRSTNFNAINPPPPDPDEFTKKHADMTGLNRPSNRQ